MGSDFTVAVHAASGGVALDVDVVPGAAASVFPAGFNAWRKRLEARVRAPPEGGEANAELAALVADVLGVPGARVSVTSGHTSRRKTLTVAGAARDAIIARISERLPGGGA